MNVIGTAGHVDHGKSALVRALTGTDPDRWAEERERGMTLDLGFAQLRFEDGVEAGIVDVPGHERFLHNMLAGAAGMDVLLLIVAANEGPGPQTLEHLEILRYLNVRQTIVALTKIDLLDAGDRAGAAALARDALAETIAAGAPLVAVSSLTGEGLAALRAAIHAALVALPKRASDAPAYLPIDRVFTLPGHGTIVTGTLMQGTIAGGDRLRLTPLEREVRVRSLQVFGAGRESVAGGSRVAAGLAGVERSEIARGAVLASAQFTSASSVEVSFRAHPAARAVLRRRTPVRAYIGSAEILGTLVFPRVPDDAHPVAATLHLRQATVFVPGAAFVVRGLSPKTLLGGGTLGAVPAGGVAGLSGEEPERAAILTALAGAGIEGADAARAGAAANLREERAEELLATLAGEGRVLVLQRPAGYVDATLANACIERALAELRRVESETPWVLGMTSLALARALAMPEAPLARLLAAAADDVRLTHRSGYFATLGFVPKLSAEQHAFFAGYLSGGNPASNPGLPFAFADLQAAMRGARIPGLAAALETLLGSGALVKVDDALYRGEQIAAIRERLERTLRRDKQITPAAFRDLVGTSRKFALPLLEYFDRSGVTIRTGDVRVLRKPHA